MDAPARHNHPSTRDHATPAGDTVSAVARSSTRELRRRWFVFVTLGATLGWAFPMLAFLSVDERAPRTLAVTLLLTGAAGGVVFALAQVCILRRWLSAFPVLGWVMATAVAAVIEWTVMMLAVVYGDRVAVLPGITQAPIVVAGMLAATFALGVCQWLVLRRWSDEAVLWVWANAVAWVMGTTAFVAVAHSIHGTIPPTSTTAVVLTVVAAVVRGVVIALITGVYLAPILAGEHLHAVVSRDYAAHPAWAHSYYREWVRVAREHTVRARARIRQVPVRAVAALCARDTRRAPTSPE